MARESRREGPRERREHERRPDHDREEDGDDPLRHAQIIQRRWLGSPPPTLERYAHALRQWQRLAGAVVRPATTVAVEPPAQTDASQAPAEGESEP